MNKIAEWAIGKPLVPAMMAQEGVLLAGEIEKYLDILRKGGRELKELPALPPVSEWLPLYRNHRAVQARMIDAFSPRRPGRVPLSVYWAAVSGWLRLFRPDNRELLVEAAKAIPPKQWERELRQGQRLVNLVFRRQQEGLAKAFEKLGKDQADRIERAMQAPEVQFMFRVYMPCLLYGGDYPTRLLARARHGDFEAIDVLLRLDKTLIYEKGIARMVVNAGRSHARGLLRRISQSLGQFPKKLSNKKGKNRMAAIISDAFKPFGGISAEEVRKLFDSVKIVETGDAQAQDDDLMMESASVQTMIRRTRKKQHIFPSLSATKTKSKVSAQ